MPGYRLHCLLALRIVLLAAFTAASPLAAAPVGAGAANLATNSSDFARLDWPGVSGTRSDPLAQTEPLFVVRARRGGPLVRSGPRDDAAPISGVYYDTYLPVYGLDETDAGVIWYKVLLWGSLFGWVRADQTEPGDPPSPTPSSVASDPAPVATDDASSAPSSIIPLHVTGTTTDLVNLRAAPGADQDQVALIGAGESLPVDAYQTDTSGSVWYRVQAEAGTGWIWSGGMDLVVSRDPGASVDGRPSWDALTGKGMWLPASLAEMASPESIVSAARTLGLSHIYLEVGASGQGFYGKRNVDRLLRIAHASGIDVIGWVLTTLDNIPSDEKLCEEIATYRTADGERLDGIAPDVEFNMDRADVAAFSQILRLQLGPANLIAGVIYPTVTWIGQQHPIADILARSFDALVLMDYWRQDPGPIDADAVRRFVETSVTDARDVVGSSSYPVAVILQAYDRSGRNGIGPDNPSSAELRAALAGANRGGADGISLFQWGTATPGEWEVLRDFPWPDRPRYETVGSADVQYRWTIARRSSM